eukprot:738939_1
MTTNFLSKGTEIIQQAVIKDNAEEYDIALNLYSTGIQYLLTALKYEKNQKITEAIKSKTIKYLKRGEEIKDSLSSIQSKQNKKCKKKPRMRANSNSNSNSDNNSDDEEIGQLQRGLCNAIVIDKPNVKWSDVAGLQVAKSLLKEAD